MFLAGADGRTPELRSPSIKGMMRFWWRALHEHLTIEKLKEDEAKIFGTSDETIGRSKFSIRVNKQLINNDIVKSLWEEIPSEERTSERGKKYKVPKKYEA
ncbi:MAG: type III-B CRISPR module RAMP protein Cmr1 [Candidatus Methanoperedens sp.]|nr:MAG: type III-B CRISPR module RAMP protein Cmr1 [Candidatus Methanoperedens sp.]